MKFFKTQKERDQTSDDDLLKRSESLGIKPEILLDLKARERYRKTIGGLKNTISLFVIAYIVKLYLNYRWKMVVFGTMIMSSGKIANILVPIVTNTTSNLVD